MRKTKANDWIFFVESDLAVARRALSDGIYHIACFHAQQAVEKLLKAFLASQNRAIPKIHNLLDLYRLILPMLPKLTYYQKTLEELDQYYVPTRYPDALPGATPEGLPAQTEAQEAIANAEVFASFIRPHLSSH